MKQCSKCLQEKPLSGFYARAESPDGLRNDCISCFADRRRINYLKNKERELANNASYAQTQAGASATAEAKRRWESRNAHKIKAKRDLNNAIRDGKVRRDPCFVCGEKAQGHHPDYSRPLMVTWLCTPHHSQLHREFRGIK